MVSRWVFDTDMPRVAFFAPKTKHKKSDLLFPRWVIFKFWEIVISHLVILEGNLGGGRQGGDCDRHKNAVFFIGFF